MRCRRITTFTRAIAAIICVRARVCFLPNLIDPRPALGTNLKCCCLQRFLQEHGEVQLSALGIAISSMVTVAEILKNKQLAEESRITTSLEWLSAESRWVTLAGFAATAYRPKHSIKVFVVTDQAVMIEHTGFAAVQQAFRTFGGHPAHAHCTC